MQTDDKRCDTCQATVLKSTSEVVKSSLVLAKDDMVIYVCVDCCELGRHKYMELEGYRQMGYKLALQGK